MRAGLGQRQGGAEILPQVDRLGAGSVGGLWGLATVLRYRLERPQEADRYMDTMVGQNPKSFKAHLWYAQYLLQQVNVIANPDKVVEQAKLAAAEAEKALALSPEDRTGLILVAQAQLRAGNRPRAEECVAPAKSCSPAIRRSI